MGVGTAVTALLVDDGAVGLGIGLGITGAAFAFVQSPLLGSLGSVLPRDRIGLGNGLYLMVFFLGGAFGVAFALTVLGLQPEDAPSWVGWVEAPHARYGNAMIALAVLGTVGTLALPWLAGPKPELRPA